MPKVRCIQRGINLVCKIAVNRVDWSDLPKLVRFYNSKVHSSGQEKQCFFLDSRDSSLIGRITILLVLGLGLGKALRSMRSSLCLPCPKGVVCDHLPR